MTNSVPPVVGVLFLVLAWGIFELVVWLVRRRIAGRGDAAPARAPASTALTLTRSSAARSAVASSSVARGPREACVVLVHGFGGFDELRLAGRRAAYFRGVRERFTARGIACVVPRLPSVASIEARARVLADELAGLAHLDVHVIAHSMGGLDARYALARYGAGGVRSLVTIATPHRGTPLAALGARIVGGRRLAVLNRALQDLSPERVAGLADDLVAARGVRYGSVLVAPRDGAVHPLLVPTHRLLSRWVGDNDGVVPLASQTWGEVLATVDTDHWGVVGWGRGGFDAPAFYASLALRVAGLGDGEAAAAPLLAASFPTSPQ
jgi:triacylglycerol lipase